MQIIMKVRHLKLVTVREQAKEPGGAENFFEGKRQFPSKMSPNKGPLCARLQLRANRRVVGQFVLHNARWQPDKNIALISANKLLKITGRRNCLFPIYFPNHRDFFQGQYTHGSPVVSTVLGTLSVIIYGYL